jgi:hypothetical protein
MFFSFLKEMCFELNWQTFRKKEDIWFGKKRRFNLFVNESDYKEIFSKSNIMKKTLKDKKTEITMHTMEKN